MQKFTIVMDEEDAKKHNKREEDKRRFAGEKIPSMKRRSQEHDYHSKRFYMITLVVKERYALLGRLVGSADAAEDSPEAPRVERSPLGEAIAREWAGISDIYKEVAVIAQCVMPDHLHGILYVKEHTDFHLGQVVRGFKLGCNRILRAALETQRTREGGEQGTLETQRTREGEDGCFAVLLRSYAANTSQPIGRETLWELKYNDKILHNYSTLDKWKAYLHDNPRRLAIRRAHPDYFRVQFGVTIAGRQYAAIGNRFLLNYPDKQQVQLSRKLTEEQIHDNVEKFLCKAHNGAVLVSPAISDGEAVVMRTVLNAQLPLIFLTPWGFNTFSKPGHQYYEACSEGRFLMLAPWPHQNEKIPLTRSMCLELNRMAEEICNI